LAAHELRLSREVLRLWSHTINAHQIWNSRILHEPPLGVYDVHTIQEAAKIDIENQKISLDIINHRDLDEVIHYANTAGKEFENTIRDILFHISNHTTHHRAQVARLLREAEILPPASDYIFYRRS
jgi:uncharacterized damage-inducible protein DinB